MSETKDSPILAADIHLDHQGAVRSDRRIQAARASAEEAARGAEGAEQDWGRHGVHARDEGEEEAGAVDSDADGSDVEGRQGTDWLWLTEFIALVGLNCFCSMYLT